VRARLPTAFEGPVTPGAIQQQIEAWQPVLGLADWDVRYSPDPVGDDERACIDGWVVRRIAVIRIDAGAPVEAIDRLIVHELMHLWLSQLQELVTPSQAFTPPHVDAAFAQAWDRVEHQLLHVLEGAITGRPMVMWSKGEATWTKPWWLSSDEKTA
jgi:hypothetical protein